MSRFVKKLTTNQGGFTLLELLLAMTLFITVTVIATVGFIGMNRVFVRGMARKALSESVQRVTEDITKTVRANSTVSGTDTKTTSNGDYGYLCIGTTRYVWPKRSQYGLYKQIGVSECVDGVNTNNSEQLVEGRFVVADLQVAPVADSGSNNNLVSIKGVVRTTEDSAFNINTTNPYETVCKGSAENTAVRTCALEKFEFIVGVRPGAPE